MAVLAKAHGKKSGEKKNITFVIKQHKTNGHANRNRAIFKIKYEKR